VKPRHAAALVLVGWYLMMPPWRPALDVNAPLSGWVPFQEGFMGVCASSDYRKRIPPMGAEYKDLPDCEASQTKLKYAVTHRSQNWRVTSEDRLHPSEKHFEIMVGHSLCIADDDARLKGNIRYKGN
jgi:hypothetical protein